MRGKELEASVEPMADRITPAYAGKRTRPPAWCCSSGDHPRVCGEKLGGGAAQLSRAGSPPRMRGKETAEKRHCICDRITPAYAGKSAVNIR